MASPTVLFLPVDDRPVTRALFLKLAGLTDTRVQTPPLEVLGDRTAGADLTALWLWVDDHASKADLCIAAAEMPCYGGLVPSRVGAEPVPTVVARADQLLRIADRIPTYLAAVNLRIPATAEATEEPAYWRQHGNALARYSHERDRWERTGAAEAHDAMIDALAAVPAPVLEDFLWRRRRNFLVNLHLLGAAAHGRVRYLLIGQDDASPYGLARSDREVLSGFVDALDAAGRAATTTGADELCCRLLARATNERLRAQPTVRVVYTSPLSRRAVPTYEIDPLEDTVRSHVESVGGKLVDGDAEITLIVHNFAGPRQLEAFAQPFRPDPLATKAREEIAAAKARGTICAVADVRYANGADDALVAALLEESQASGVDAYAGWNTSSNTLGTVLAHAMLLLHLRKGAFGPVADRREQSKRLLIERLLDDWGYQAHVRWALAKDVLPKEPECSSADIGPAEARFVQEAQRRFEQLIIPKIARSFGVQLSVAVTFPWHRLFDVGLDLTVR